LAPLVRLPCEPEVPPEKRPTLHVVIDQLVETQVTLAPDPGNREKVIPSRFTGPVPAMELLYYDREGRPVSRIQWHQLGRQPGYSGIARTAIVRHGRKIIVDTRWLGSADAAGPARIFQTYGEIRRRGAPRQSYRRRWGWTSLEAARTGHQEIVGWLTGVADWLAGVTDQMPPPPQAPLAASARPG
jgi:hypothetical protein